VTKKLVLAVIDALKPEMLARAIEDGSAPALKAIVDRGTFIADCVPPFPSVTPACASTIATGLSPADHLIPSMNWFHRGEERYVEYGSSFAATRAFGVQRSLYDTVYNMNMAHLTGAHRTVFEHLDDAGLRTACTTYLIYRGRYRHDPVQGRGLQQRLAEAAQFHHAVWGARELFYADLFDSRATGCTSNLGMPGMRDRHAGCVGAHAVEHDLFDFMLLSLPDNDTHSHRHGPYGQAASIAEADRAMEQVMHAAGGIEAFLDEHAVIVMSDHSQSQVEDRLNLAEVLAGWRVLLPADSARDRAELAVCPSQRSAMVYVLDEDQRDAEAPEIVADLLRVEGVDLALRLDGEEAVVASGRGELRFAPGDTAADRRGRSWDVEGELDALELTIADGRVDSVQYPDALGRVWDALGCPNAGDVLVSAAPGYEFTDWGGADHVGGGSHGSLHRADSLGALVLSGVENGSAVAPEQWSVADVTPLVLGHFSLPLPHA
jgi:hypothetical protein